MGKNVLVISSSLRVTSNSAILAHEIVRGAADAGNQAEFLSLVGKELGFCTGCLACQQSGTCVINDDASLIVDKVRCADVLVFATPVYYYGMSGQLKTLLDRLNPLYGSDYGFREVYAVCTAADSSEDTPAGVIGGIENWLSCFKNAQFKGTLFCGGVDGAADVMKKQDIMEKAYLMGLRI